MIQGIERSYHLVLLSVAGTLVLTCSIFSWYTSMYPSLKGSMKFQIPLLVLERSLSTFFFLCGFLIFFFVSLLPLDGTSQLLAFFINLSVFTAFEPQTRKLNTGTSFVGRDLQDFEWTAGCSVIPEMC